MNLHDDKSNFKHFLDSLRGFASIQHNVNTYRQGEKNTRQREN